MTNSEAASEQKKTDDGLGSKLARLWMSLPARILMSMLAAMVGSLGIASLFTWLAFPSSSLSIGPFTLNTPSFELFGVSSLFLAAIFFVMFIIALQMTREPFSNPTPKKLADGDGLPANRDVLLEVKEVLKQEFEYGRETAAQAMEHRMTIVNFYLLIVGGAGSIIGALLATNSGLKNGSSDPFFFATVALLWLVFLIGWLTLFKIVRLRAAWGESVMAMNYIKEFYITNAKDAAPNVLASAFLFRAITIPKAYKSWTVFHFSALLIALLDASAFLAGFMLLGFYLRADSGVIFAGAALAVIAFFGHVWAYDIALKPKVKPADDDKQKPIPENPPAAANGADASASTPQLQTASATGPPRRPNTVVGTSQIYPGKLIKLRVDEIRLPDGQPDQREIVEHQPAAVIVAYLDATDEFLFVEQYRDAIQTFLLEVPAGLVDSGEAPEETAIRELREETGYEIGDLIPLGSYYTSPGFTDERHHLFLARQLTRVAGIADPNEISSVRAISRDDVLGMIERGEMQDGKSILGILWSLRHLPERV